jgi:ParB family chromosome partitioning protein
MAKPALGRGLGALLGGKPIAKPPGSAEVSKTPSVDTTAPATSSDAVRRVPLAKVVPCPFQPRKNFAPEALKELADSIREQGIVQPLVVREQGGKFELIAGERRWRASQLIGLKEVPVIVRVADDRTVLELALIENLQRENLNAIEEAQGYSQLQDQFSLTQEEVATKVGKSRAAVANALRLLKLPVAVQEKLRKDELSVGHAKVILGLPTDKLQTAAADRIIADKLNVRQTEVLVAKLLVRASTPATTTVAVPVRDAHITSLEGSIRERVGTKVHLRYNQGKGSLEIVFFSDAELERILDILGVRND